MNFIQVGDEMYKKCLLFALVLFFFIPTNVFAVDFTITDVEIDAYLQSDGNVNVVERHTYEFDGEFNGIIRNLISNDGAEIVELQAFEQGSPLKVETDGAEHRIYRKGKDETITIDLQYTIERAVSVYSDFGDFFWSVFSQENESTYENMTITIHPPAPTTKVIAFGYDEAFESEQVLNDGTVRFDLGRVRRKRNGDIRVLIPAELFPHTMNRIDKEIREDVIAEREAMIYNAIRFKTRQQRLSTIATIVIPLFFILYLFILLKVAFQKKLKNMALEREVERKFLPDLELSMPLTIYFTHYKLASSELMAAHLLDLVRRGNVELIGDQKFRLIKNDHLAEYDQALIEWLFEEIGTNNQFDFEMLKKYTKKEKNHEKYQELEHEWQLAFHNCIKEEDLYEEKTKFRTFIGFAALPLLPLMLGLFIYDLMGGFVIAFILFLGILFFAIGYQTTNWRGAKILHEWNELKERLKSLDMEEWNRLSQEDQMKVLIYGIGVNAKSFRKKNEEMIEAFNMNNSVSVDSGVLKSYNPLLFIMLANSASKSFHKAGETTTPASNSSSSGFGSGGRGGGGGSGAF